MAYPNPTTYTLPFGDKVRVSSRRRFVLVRQRVDAVDPSLAQPFVVKRSDTFGTVYRFFNTEGSHVRDYFIDQLQGTVMTSFNGRHEVHYALGGRTLTLITTVPYGSSWSTVEAALVRTERISS